MNTLESWNYTEEELLNIAMKGVGVILRPKYATQVIDDVNKALTKNKNPEDEIWELEKEIGNLPDKIKEIKEDNPKAYLRVLQIRSYVLGVVKKMRKIAYDMN